MEINSISFCLALFSLNLYLVVGGWNPVHREPEKIVNKRTAFIDYHKTNDWLNGNHHGKKFGKGIHKGMGLGRMAAPVMAPPPAPPPLPYLDFKDYINEPIPRDPELGPPKPGEPPPPIPPCPEDKSAMKPPPNPDNEIGPSGVARIKTQDRYLQILAHKVAIFGIPENFTQEPENSFTLFKKTVGIFKHYCPIKVIPEAFIDNVVQTFELLHNYLTPARTKYTTDEEFNWINLFLDNCSNGTSQSGSFVYGEICSDEILGDSMRNPICEPGEEKTSPQMFDPMLDIVWRIFELAHTVCFDYFSGFSRIWHRYTAAIEDLFTLPIKQRWSYPTQDETFFKRLLGPFYKIYSSNIGKCVQYYAARSKIGVRVHRFNQPFTIRYGHNNTEIFETEDFPTRPPRSGAPPAPP